MDIGMLHHDIPMSTHILIKSHQLNIVLLFLKSLMNFSALYS
jgi:hypothetical protein